MALNFVKFMASVLEGRVRSQVSWAGWRWSLVIIKQQVGSRLQVGIILRLASVRKVSGGVDILRIIIKLKGKMRPPNAAAINRWFGSFGSRKSQKRVVIYLYILVIFLSTFSFYTILQIESEKQSKSKHKIRKKLIKTQTKSEENVDIPNLPSGKFLN